MKAENQQTMPSKQFNTVQNAMARAVGSVAWLRPWVLLRLTRSWNLPWEE
jgi:hypothetical protein